MLIEFHGQLALVTGGAGGIGYTCVKTLLESGARVAILDVNQAALDRAAAELSPLGEVRGYAIDLSDADARWGASPGWRSPRPTGTGP